jgi:predicted dehydrogenase
MAKFRLVPAAGGPVHGAGPAEVTETAGFNMLTAELEAFAAAVAAQRPFPTPMDQIMHGVAVFEAVAASAVAGVPVPVQRISFC